MILANVARILWARKWIGVTSVISSVVSAYAVSQILPPRYEAISTVVLDVSEPDPVTGISQGGPGARMYQRTLMSVLKSDRVALDVVNRLNLTRRADYVQAFRDDTGGKGELARWIAKKIGDDLDAKLPEVGNLMTVSYRMSDPRTAQQILNTFVDSFIKATLDLKVTPAQANAKWYDGEIGGLRKGLDEAQARHDAYPKKGAAPRKAKRMQTLKEKLQERAGTP